jgi:hypothetical protein
MGENTQAPSDGVQESLVQALSSLQTTGVVALQLPVEGLQARGKQKLVISGVQFL